MNFKNTVLYLAIFLAPSVLPFHPLEPTRQFDLAAQAQSGNRVVNLLWYAF